MVRLHTGVNDADRDALAHIAHVPRTLRVDHGEIPFFNVIRVAVAGGSETDLNILFIPQDGILTLEPGKRVCIHNGKSRHAILGCKQRGIIRAQIHNILFIRRVRSRRKHGKKHGNQQNAQILHDSFLTASKDIPDYTILPAAMQEKAERLRNRLTRMGAKRKIMRSA